MSRTDKRDPSDERTGGSGGIHDEKCCEGAECCWRPNTPAQSEGGMDGKQGGGYRREWTDD